MIHIFHCKALTAIITQYPFSMPPELHTFLFTPRKYNSSNTSTHNENTTTKQEKRPLNSAGEWGCCLPSYKMVLISFLQDSCSQLLLSCALSMGCGREKMGYWDRSLETRNSVAQGMLWCGGNWRRKMQPSHWFVNHWHYVFYLPCSWPVQVWWSLSLVFFHLLPLLCELLHMSDDPDVSPPLTVFQFDWAIPGINRQKNTWTGCIFSNTFCS